MARAIQANIVQMPFTNCFEIAIGFCHYLTVLELASINNYFKLTCGSEIIMTLDWLINIMVIRKDNVCSASLK